MAWKYRRLKRFFATPQQPEIHVFFLDRNLGKKQLAALLEEESFVIRVHDDHFKPDESDDVWLAACGQRRWIVITADKMILKDPISMRAIGSSRCRVFFLPQNNKNPRMWGPILVSAWTEMHRILSTREGPFVANISPNGIWRLKELNSRGAEKKKETKKMKLGPGQIVDRADTAERVPELAVPAGFRLRSRLRACSSVRGIIHDIQIAFSFHSILLLRRAAPRASVESHDEFAQFDATPPEPS
jgi:hypothetical protein